MKGAAYTLSAVRTAREQAKEDARLRLEQERGRLQVCGQTLEAARVALQALDDERATRLQARASTGAELARLGAEQARLELRRREAMRARDEAQRAHAVQLRKVQAAEALLQEALAEHAVIERHHAQFRAEEQRLSQRAEGDEQDDVLASRASHRDREGISS